MDSCWPEDRSRDTGRYFSDGVAPFEEFFRQDGPHVAGTANQQDLAHGYLPSTAQTSPKESGGMRTSSGFSRL